jgi:hypothetical protein
MNATDIVAWTRDGAMYCLDCWDGEEGEEDSPVFAGEEFDRRPSCDACLCAIEELGPDPEEEEEERD